MSSQNGHPTRAPVLIRARALRRLSIRPLDIRAVSNPVTAINNAGRCRRNLIAPIGRFPRRMTRRNAPNLAKMPIGCLSYYDSRMRIDKWLWAARFFKTRTLASRACELGRIECGGQKVKPARELHAGDLLEIRNESGNFEVQVLLLSEMRGPAPVAQTLYRETEASREERLKLAAERKAMPRIDSLPEGKPSKRDRRSLERLRGKW